MPRSLPEWIGKTNDTPVPPRVRVRVFDRHDGVCHICKGTINAGEKWHIDHIIALIAGGENRESNFAPAHERCNLSKANGEKKEKAKVARTRGKHIGAIRPKSKIKNRGFSKVARNPKPPLPPRPLYQETTP